MYIKFKNSSQVIAVNICGYSSSTTLLQWLKNKLDVRYEIEGSGPRKEL